MATSSNTRSDEMSADKDAIAMLMADHKKVKALFAEFEKLKHEGGEEEKAAIVEQICNELKVHAAIEEEIFYPAVRKAIDDADLMDEAMVEHAGAKDLITQLEDADPDDDYYDAKVTVLCEQIEHHVKEEEGDMFPRAAKAKVDTAALGAKMLKRKLALMADMGMSQGDERGAQSTHSQTRMAGAR